MVQTTLYKYVTIYQLLSSRCIVIKYLLILGSIYVRSLTFYSRCFQHDMKASRLLLNPSQPAAATLDPQHVQLVGDVQLGIVFVQI